MVSHCWVALDVGFSEMPTTQALRSDLTETLEYCDFPENVEALGEKLVSVVSVSSSHKWLEQLHTRGMMLENWRSALPLRAQSGRKVSSTLNDQTARVGWLDAKHGLSRRPQPWSNCGIVL